jgi:hypothetical protein
MSATEISPQDWLLSVLRERIETIAAAVGPNSGVHPSGACVITSHLANARDAWREAAKAVEAYPKAIAGIERHIGLAERKLETELAWYAQSLASARGGGGDDVGE